MATVNLDINEWNQVIAVLSQAPWNVANPLLMRIGDQLRGQAEPLNQAATDLTHKTNSRQDVFEPEHPKRN